MITDKDILKLKGVFITKEDMIMFKDQILHEIIKLREDITIVIGYRDMIEDHEVRIDKLEVRI